MKYLIGLTALLSILLISYSCNKDSTSPVDESNCEMVVNAHGPGFLKVVNELNSQIDVDFSSIPLSALMESRVCELYGLPLGDQYVVIRRRSSGAEKQIDFTITNGNTHTIRVNDGFF